MAPVSPRSGSELARIIGWQQPRVSKLETGKQLPTEADIRAWVAASGAIEGGLTKAQAAQAAAEARVTYIAEWQPALVPGLVQTAAYARELLERPDRSTLTDPGDVDPDAMAAGRVRRQDVLYPAGPSHRADPR